MNQDHNAFLIPIRLGISISDAHTIVERGSIEGTVHPDRLYSKVLNKDVFMFLSVVSYLFRAPTSRSYTVYETTLA